MPLQLIAQDAGLLTVGRYRHGTLSPSGFLRMLVWPSSWIIALAMNECSVILSSDAVKFLNRWMLLHRDM